MLCHPHAGSCVTFSKESSSWLNSTADKWVSQVIKHQQVCQPLTGSVSTCPWCLGYNNTKLYDVWSCMSCIPDVWLQLPNKALIFMRCTQTWQSRCSVPSLSAFVRVPTHKCYSDWTLCYCRWCNAKQVFQNSFLEPQSDCAYQVSC